MAPLSLRATPVRAATLVLALSLAGCSSISNMVSGDRVDYRSQAAAVQPLEVPPDLTQLAREGRYTPQAGVVVSASTMKQPGSATAPVAAGGTAVAPDALADLRVVREGQQRWLVSAQPPEKLYPLVRAFWLERGFQLSEDNPTIGLLETDWAENRAKLPDDIIRRTLGRLVETLYSTGERDKFRTRIERSADGKGSEIRITHRGMVENYTDKSKDATRWQPRASDPELEGEMVARLMVRLGSKDEAARSAVASAAPAATATPGTGRATVASGATTLELDDGFERAWRLVGLALDRSGFTVEDRDRGAGLYFVRYADPKLASQEEPNFFAKLFSRDSDAATKRLQRYRVVVKAAGAKSQVAVQTSDGAPESGEAAKAIIGRLGEALR